MPRAPWLPPPEEISRGGPQPPAFNVPSATLILAAVLVAVFVLQLFLPAAKVYRLDEALSFNAARLADALHGRASLAAVLPTLVSHLFLHADELHLGVNVGFLIAFASPVERRLGAGGFLALFLASGVAGALAEAWFFPDSASFGVPMIGASGGVMGLMATALLVGIPVPRRPGRPVDPELVRRMRVAVRRILIALVALNVAIGLLSELGLTGPYLIGWRAHLGGFAVGLLVGWLLRPRPTAAT